MSVVGAAACGKVRVAVAAGECHQLRHNSCRVVGCNRRSMRRPAAVVPVSSLVVSMCTLGPCQEELFLESLTVAAAGVAAGLTSSSTPYVS